MEPNTIISADLCCTKLAAIVKTYFLNFHLNLYFEEASSDGITITCTTSRSVEVNFALRVHGLKEHVN
jgi:hypothetical protein